MRRARPLDAHAARFRADARAGERSGTGRSVTLDLLPLDADPGAGSRMSLAAYQALGLPLTALPELRVSPAG